MNECLYVEAGIENKMSQDITAGESLALGTWVKLSRAAESVAASLRPSLLERGLTESQFGVLEALFSKGPMCQRDLGQKILKTSGNITLVIDNLEKQGWVRRERDKEDRRQVTVSLTEEGDAFIRDIFPDHARHVERALGGLTEAEQEELGRLCRKLGLSVRSPDGSS